MAHLGDPVMNGVALRPPKMQVKCLIHRSMPFHVNSMIEGGVGSHLEHQSCAVAVKDKLQGVQQGCFSATVQAANEGYRLFRVITEFDFLLSAEDPDVAQAFMQSIRPQQCPANHLWYLQ